MKNTPLIFFGSSKLVIPIIETLHANFDLKLVITTEQKPSDAVPSYCQSHIIPFISIQNFRDETIKQLKTINAPVAVLADFGLILPDIVLNLFPHGIINVHPSLLPKFRGPTPIQSAILADDTETGVTIIRLDDQVDHGPILAQENEPILDTDTSESLHIRLFTKGAHMLITVLPEYLNGEIKPTYQDHSKATFTERLNRNSGYIDMDSLKIENFKLKIARMIRAYYPWPGVWTTLHLSATKKQTKRIKLLPNQMLQVEGKKPVNYKDFLNGYPENKESLENLGLM